MTPQRWVQIKELFQQALSQAEDEREDVLQKQAGEDLSLRAEVESLLAHHEEAHTEGLLHTQSTDSLGSDDTGAGSLGSTIDRPYRQRRSALANVALDEKTKCFTSPW